MLYASAARSILEADAFPDQPVWEYEDTVLTDFDGLPDAIRERLTERDIPVDLLDIDSQYIGVKTLYVLRCPNNLAKMIFLEAWPKMLRLEQEFPDIRYPAFLPVPLELAQAVDHIEDDANNSCTQMVWSELNRARATYNYY